MNRKILVADKGINNIYGGFVRFLSTLTWHLVTLQQQLMFFTKLLKLLKFQTTTQWLGAWL